MNILSFDTETTGLPLKVDSALELQPHIMQLAASLYTSDRRPIYEFSILVNLPEGVTPHPRAYETHGISPEMCRAFGVPKRTALKMLAYAVNRADRVIAHNAEFDMNLIGFDSRRVGMEHPVPKALLLCTCDAATAHLKLPPTPKMKAAGFTKPKKANLGECFQHYFNEELSGAHDALVDTRGAARVYFHLLDLGVIKEE